jgi:hypothetical protein
MFNHLPQFNCIDLAKMLNQNKAGKVYRLTKYYHTVDREVHVLKEAVVLAELQVQNKQMRQMGLTHYIDLVEEEEVKKRVPQVQRRLDQLEVEAATQARNKKRLRDVFISFIR